MAFSAVCEISATILKGQIKVHDSCYKKQAWFVFFFRLGHAASYLTAHWIFAWKYWPMADQISK
jgi:hypothetical protein